MMLKVVWNYVDYVTVESKYLLVLAHYCMIDREFEQIGKCVAEERIREYEHAALPHNWKGFQGDG